MATARPKEGPRAPLFYLPLLVLAWVLPAASQQVELSELEICAGLGTDELKLACFEAIIATGRRAVAAVPEVDVAPDPVVVPAEPGSGAGSESAPPVVDAGAEPASAPVVVSAATGIPSESATPRPAAAAPEVSETAESIADTFGSEHLQKDDPEAPPELKATVVEVTTTSRDALVFHLDNGQVWRQIEPRYYPYPRGREFDVTISTGMLGEYRLQVEGAGRRVTIRRVK